MTEAPKPPSGWGGPATGIQSNSKRGIPGPGRPKGMKTGEGKAARARKALLDAAPAAAQMVIDIAKDQTDSRALMAALAILNRVGLHEKAAVEHTGEGGGPVEIAWLVVDPTRD